MSAISNNFTSPCVPSIPATQSDPQSPEFKEAYKFFRSLHIPEIQSEEDMNTVESLDLSNMITGDVNMPFPPFIQKRLCLNEEEVEKTYSKDEFDKINLLMEKINAQLEQSYTRPSQEDLRHLKQLPNLKHLNLSLNYALCRAPAPMTADGLKHLAELTNLQSLNLYCNELSDENVAYLANLINLEELNLFQCGIGPEGAEHIAKLTNLKSLNMKFNKIEDEGAKAFASLTNLEELDVPQNGIGPEGAKSLANLTKLRRLNLSYNEIEAEGAKQIATLTNLRKLDLENSQIHDEGAKSLTALVDLEELNLNSNNIKDEGVQSLPNLSKLRTLKIGSNHGISKEGLESIVEALENGKLELAELKYDKYYYGSDHDSGSTQETFQRRLEDALELSKSNLAKKEQALSSKLQEPGKIYV